MSNSFANSAQLAAEDRQFCLPDVGEGLPDAEILSWRVVVGQRVAMNEVIVEIETAKAAVELPSPFEGVVTAILVPVGQVVPVGTPLIRIGAGTGPGEEPSPGPDPLRQRAADPEPEPEPGARKSVLVGYGVIEETRSRRPRPSPRPLASPPVRKLAKDAGIDLAAVAPTGNHGEVTRADLARMSYPPPQAQATAAESGSVTAVRGVRRATAEAMTLSASTIPQAAVWLDADVTRTVRLLERLREQHARTAQGPKNEPKPTLLHLAAKATMLAIGEHPELASRWDDSGAEGPRLVRTGQIGLGIAAATGRGLLVPVVADAGGLGFRELSRRISEVIARARAGTASPGDLTGATITLTNVGVFGVDGGIPLLPPGQTAIVCLGQAAQRPWVHRGRVRVRHVMQLSMAFDHRVIDGQEASLFLADLASLLTDPAGALGF